MYPCFLLLFAFFQIYGYITSSDVKILALIERDGILPFKKRNEIDIKILLVRERKKRYRCPGSILAFWLRLNYFLLVALLLVKMAVHECFVNHTMNPFTKLRGKIEPPCEGFEDGILAAMREYNDAVAVAKGV